MQIPIGGEPTDVTSVCAGYSYWLSVTPGLPKLLVNADSGTILTGAQRQFGRTWPDQNDREPSRVTPASGIRR